MILARKPAFIRRCQRILESNGLGIYRDSAIVQAAAATTTVSSCSRTIGVVGSFLAGGCGAIDDNYRSRQMQMLSICSGWVLKLSNTSTGRDSPSARRSVDRIGHREHPHWSLSDPHSSDVSSLLAWLTQSEGQRARRGCKRARADSAGEANRDAHRAPPRQALAF